MVCALALEKCSYRVIFLEKDAKSKTRRHKVKDISAKQLLLKGNDQIRIKGIRKQPSYKVP